MTTALSKFLNVVCMPLIIPVFFGLSVSLFVDTCIAQAPEVIPKRVYKIAESAFLKEGGQPSKYNVKAARLHGDRWIVNYAAKPRWKNKRDVVDYGILVNSRTGLAKIEKGTFISFSDPGANLPLAPSQTRSTK